MSNGPIRPLTKRQRQIADGIGRGLSYAQIGAEIGLGASTVKQYVHTMALLFNDAPDLPPRWRIFMWVKQCEWEAQHAAKTRSA